LFGVFFAVSPRVVVVVSVGGGGGGVPVVSVSGGAISGGGVVVRGGATVSVAVAGGRVRVTGFWRGRGVREALEGDEDIIGCGISMTRGWGQRDDGGGTALPGLAVAGKVPASDPSVVVPARPSVVDGRVKFEVVSALVPVSGALEVAGAAPPPIVVVTPLADPS
jgi:hypothetical protein